MSPRLHRRGRIEAKDIQKLKPLLGFGLHGFTAVVELKRRDENLPRFLPHARLHGVAAIAEVKPEHQATVRGQKARLHGFTAVAELKLCRILSGRIDERQVSTASPPWPN